MNTRRKVVITGASSGIGRATAIRFAADGWDVCVNARREARLQELTNSFPQGNHLVCPGAYQEPAVIERARELLSRQWGHLDALVNCAGVCQPLSVVDSSYTEWRKSFDIMLDGGVLMTRLVVPLMKPGGRIVHITSIHGNRAEAQFSAYSMVKAALNQFCRCLAVELADRGILVNAIAPGFVTTEMSIRSDGVNELNTDWFRTNYVEGHHLPLKRPAKPEEVAGVAAFLAGPDAAYITGQTIIVDGGLSITF